MMAKRKVCSICFNAPARIHGYCHACHIRLKTMRTESKNPEPVKYLTYRGFVVGLYPIGGGKLKAHPETRNADNLPKAKTLNLNEWCEGFDKNMVKAFKACVLSLCSPSVRYVKES
jgi:hypothetical protein